MVVFHVRWGLLVLLYLSSDIGWSLSSFEWPITKTSLWCSWEIRNFYVSFILKYFIHFLAWFWCFVLVVWTSFLIMFSINPFRDSIIDPAAIFAMLFGSELFEEYIGQLAMASMASMDVFTEGEDFDTKKLQEKMRVNLLYCRWDDCVLTIFFLNVYIISRSAWYK